jgi:GNAT superfamily N-acetyltransferase
MSNRAIRAALGGSIAQCAFTMRAFSRLSAMTPTLEIRPIAADACLPLRQQVLWPALPMAACAVPEDATGLHYGAFDRAQLVCVGSFFVQENARARLRKFATAVSHQRRGIGTALLERACQDLQVQGVRHLWFDARSSAQAFYRRLGFAVEGATFLKQGVEYRRMAGELATLCWHPHTTAAP